MVFPLWFGFWNSLAVASSLKLRKGHFSFSSVHGVTESDRTERLQLELLCRKKCNQMKAALDDTFYTPTNSLSEMYGAQTPRYSKPRAQIWDVPARGMRPLVERGEKVAIV